MLNPNQSVDGPAATQFDEADILEMLVRIAEALHGVVSAQTELVVHDVRRPDASVVAIHNGHVSGRTRHQSILAGPIDDLGFRDLMRRVSRDEPSVATVVDNYVTRTRDGRDLQSASTIFRDHSGAPFAAFCVNVDMAGARSIQRQIQQLLFPSPAVPLDEGESETTIDGTVAEIIDAAIAANGITVETNSKAQKVAAVRAMHARGLFLIRGSVELVAKRLGTTKFTIYNYLDEIGAQRS